MLDGFQAGLAWITVLKKRDAFRKAFTERDITRMLGNEKIIRSRAKIEATIRGARIYLDLQERGGEQDELGQIGRARRRPNARRDNRRGTFHHRRKRRPI